MPTFEELSLLRNFCNAQSAIAMSIFIDIYGFPSWAIKQKNGQSLEKILIRWNETLQDYSIEQIRDAAYKIVKFKKNMAFPTVSHMLVYLYDQEKEAGLKEQLTEIERKIAEPRIETDPIRIRKSNFYVNGQKVLPGAYEWASQRILRDVQEIFPELKNYGEIVHKAEELGWLDDGKIIEYICENKKLKISTNNLPIENFGNFKAIGNCLTDKWGYKDE